MLARTVPALPWPFETTYPPRASKSERIPHARSLDNVVLMAKEVKLSIRLLVPFRGRETPRIHPTQSRLALTIMSATKCSFRTEMRIVACPAA